MSAVPAGAMQRPAKDPIFLPPLREDLKLLPGPRSADGRPSWTLHDPARHRFLRIGWLEFEIFSRWGLGRSDQIAASVSNETALEAREGDVLDVLVFADRAGLIMPTTEAAIGRLVAESGSGKLGPAQWLLKNYLFLRLRLVNPDRFLTKLYNAISWAMTRRFAVVLVLAALVAIYLIARQWSTYTHAIMNLFTLEGAAMVAIALTVAKIIHELGHGLMTKRFGCRVTGMGVAFLVMWPVLWTDTTDAWRLTDRRKRMAIDAAGMLAEITLAVVASLAWCVLQDGPLRSAALTLSSSTWVLTVLVNTNPLMRFDGYYILSDFLDIPNLQDRAFAMTRWSLREKLFKLKDPVPEHLDAHKRRILIIYGISCWIYRFSLFLGIAFLVYNLAFKALGIFLMLIEIWWFILGPIMRELKIWRRKLGSSVSNYTQRRTAGALLLLLGIFVIPWHAEVQAPALLRAQRQAVLQTTEPGQLTSILGNRATVGAGDPIAVLNSADVSFNLIKAQANFAGLEARLNGQSFDPEGLDELQVGKKALDSAIAELHSVQAREVALTVKSPFDGIVLDVPPSLRPGQFLPRGEMVGVLVDPGSATIEAFVSEADLSRLHPGNRGFFYPESGETPIPVTVKSISPSSVRELDVQELASVNGGGIAVRKTERGVLVPDSAVYRMLLAPTSPLSGIVRRQRGGVAIAGERISLIERVYRQATAIVIRESGL